MKHMNILVYGDSLSWGIIPNSRQRFERGVRWPGVLEQALRAQNSASRVIENCLNGRRTIWEDPLKPGRRGVDQIAQAVEMNCPLDLVIIVLGTNDFQNSHDNDAAKSMEGVKALIDAVRAAPIEPGMREPEILIVAPPRIVEPKGAMAEKFQGAAARNIGFPDQLAELAAQTRVGFFDINEITPASVVDGVHLDKDQHIAVGMAIAVQVQTFLQRENASI